MNLFALLASVLALLVPDPLAALHAWDVRREAAWVSGSPAAVRALYLPASEAGERDAALLGRYRQQGLRVERLRTQVLAAAVVQRRPGRVVLRVTDRVATLVVRHGDRPVRLPRDSARTRTVELVLEAGEWRVGAVGEP